MQRAKGIQADNAFNLSLNRNLAAVDLLMACRLHQWEDANANQERRGSAPLAGVATLGAWAGAGDWSNRHGRLFLPAGPGASGHVWCDSNRATELGEYHPLPRFLEESGEKLTDIVSLPEVRRPDSARGFAGPLPKMHHGRRGHADRSRQPVGERPPPPSLQVVSAAFPQLDTTRSALPPRANRAHSGNVLLTGASCSPRARHGILLSKSESLDLLFDLFPLTSQPREDKAVAVPKMSPQFVVTQEPGVNAFHTPSEDYQCGMSSARDH